MEQKNLQFMASHVHYHGLLDKRFTKNSIDIITDIFHINELFKSHNQKYHTEISVGY